MLWISQALCFWKSLLTLMGISEKKMTWKHPLDPPPSPQSLTARIQGLKAATRELLITCISEEHESWLQERAEHAACHRDKAVSAASSLGPEKMLSCAWRAGEKKSFFFSQGGGPDFPTCPILSGNRVLEILFQTRSNDITWELVSTC